MRQAQADDRDRSGRAPPSPGYRGRPPRSCLVRAERGNPVRVQTLWPGRLTVRNAQLLGGRRMANKPTPAAERRRETANRLISPLLLMVAEQPAGYRAKPGPRERADVARWACEEEDDTTFRTDGQTGHHDGHGRRGEWTRGPPLGLASDRLAPGRARGTSVATTDLRGIKGRGPQKGPPVAEVDARLPRERSGERAAGDRAQRWSSDRRRGRCGRADRRGEGRASRKAPAHH